MKGISVIICTYNGKSHIKKALDALVLQQFSKPILWEILVVDNASTDGTGNYCDAYLHEQHVAYQIVDEAKAGLNHARKKGIETAKYDVVLFCDDDNLLCSDYVQRGFELMNTHQQIGVLGGYGEPIFEGEKPEWFERYSHSFAVGAQAASSGVITTRPAEVYGAGSFFRKQILLAAFTTGYETLLSDRKGTNLSSGGDVEWCYVVQLAGYEVWYNEKLKFQHSMSRSRLQWSYYLQLKKGISKGVASLFVYEYVLKNKKSSLTAFVFTYFIKLSVCIKSFFIFQIKKAAGLYSIETVEVGNAIIPLRLIYFFKAIPVAVVNYKRVRKLQYALFQYHHTNL